MRPIPIRREASIFLAGIVLSFWFIHPMHLTGTYRPVERRRWQTTFFWSESDLK